jgi:hypothetical protein
MRSRPSGVPKMAPWPGNCPKQLGEKHFLRHHYRGGIFRMSNMSLPGLGLRSSAGL